VLVERPANEIKWDGPYVQKKDSLVDPWGRPYLYKYPGRIGMWTSTHWDRTARMAARDAVKSATW